MAGDLLVPPEARIVGDGILEVDGEEAANWFRAEPQPGFEQGEVVVALTPGLGTPPEAVRKATIEVATLSGYPTVGWDQNYAPFIDDNPFVEIPDAAARTTSRMMDAHAPGETEVIHIGQSANSVALFAHAEAEPGRTAVQVLNVPMGMDVRSTVRELVAARPGLQEELDALPIAQRASRVAQLRGGRRRALGLLGRFNFNAGVEAIDMIQDGDWDDLALALGGIGGEIISNLHIATGTPILRGPAVVGAFAMGANLDGVPSNRIAQAHGTLVGGVFGNNDRIFLNRNIMGTLAMPDAGIDMTDFFDGDQPGEGGHDMWGTKDGREHLVRSIAVGKELLARTA